MILRKATAKDIDAVNALGREAAMQEDTTWDDGYPAREQFEESLSYDGLYVAEEDGCIIATVGIQPAVSVFVRLDCWSKEHQNPCDICRLCVKPDLSGRHIAETLLRYALTNAAHEKGYDSVHFFAAKINSRANRLYERMGFSRVGETNWIGIDWICYESELTQKSS